MFEAKLGEGELPQSYKGIVDRACRRTAASGMNSSPGGERSRQDFLGVPIDCLTFAETIAAVNRAIESRQPLRLICINVAKFIEMRKNAELAHDVRSSDIICVDGRGVVWAAQLLGIAVPERVAGIDLMEGVIQLCAAKRYRPYLLGARPDVLQNLITNIRHRFPGLELAGSHHGYFGPNQERDVMVAVECSRADCLFVGMPTPRKERLLARYHDDWGVPFVMGVGGSFDVLAGKIRRAPRFVQDVGLEWLFRTMQEPVRLGPRYLMTNAAFGSIMVKALASKLLSNGRVAR
jgi:N-acetylglucosaminyldiphosphoundecaprenol N-acetyl-beta-D-mannosaminyltransferase